MKRWIKQLVYRLLGDSRRDIIGDITDELRQEKEELTELISSLKDQLAQLREGTQGIARNCGPAGIHMERFR